MENSNIKCSSAQSMAVVTKTPVPELDPLLFEGIENVSFVKEPPTEPDGFQVIINECKIDLSQLLAPPPVAMHIMSDGQSIPLFTKGNFSIITGPAKSRKSFLISMLMATAIKGDFQNLFFCDNKGENIIFDTEQSRYKAQEVAKRICKLSNTVIPTNLHPYTLRTLDPAERLQLIDTVLATIPMLNFVAIDGIIDLEIDPILQAEQAQKIIAKLMKWSEIYSIHIVCGLHFNKGASSLLGHLGSFSHRKAEAIISVTKCKEDKNISLVEVVDCREKEFAPFAFSVDEFGMPYLLQDYTFEKKVKNNKTARPKKRNITPSELDEVMHKSILNNVFNIQEKQTYVELWNNIKTAFNLVMPENLSDNRAKQYLTYYQLTNSISKVEAPTKRALYMKAK